MKGTRLPDGDIETHFKTDPGTYGRTADGAWYAVTPNGLNANLTAHEVMLHADGTISVSPSILVNKGQPVSWHGYLERGVWREC